MQSYENQNKFCQCVLFIIKHGFHYVFCCYLKTHHEFISLSWKSLLICIFTSLIFENVLLETHSADYMNQFRFLSAFSLKCVRILFRLAQSSFYLSYIYKEKFREFSVLALPCWYDRYTAMFSGNWLALRIMGGSEDFVLRWAERQGFSRTPDSLTDAEPRSVHGGEFTKNDSVTQELIWWFGGRC